MPPPIGSRGFGDVESEALQSSSKWLHVPIKQRIHIVVLSPLPFRYSGHWVNGRMRVCPGAACGWCLRRMGTQARYVLSVMDVDIRTKALFEFGAPTARGMVAALSAAGTLRGVKFALRHERERKAGTILAEEEGTWLASELLPPEDNPESAIAHQAATQGAPEMPAAWEPPPDEPSRNGAQNTYLPAAIR